MKRALSELTVALLAGGLGTRLRPSVPDVPKVIAEVRGRPFLSYVFDQLAAAEAKHVVVCTGYSGEQIRETFGDSCGALSLVYSHEPTPRGTAGALRWALPLLKSDPVLVMNGDSFCESDLMSFWEWHSQRRVDASMLTTWVHDTDRYGKVATDLDGKVLSFEEKGGDGCPGWINAGSYLFSQRFLLSIPLNGFTSLEREVLPRWIGRGLSAYQTQGRFIDIGTPDGYQSAQDFFDLELIEWDDRVKGLEM